MWSYGGAFSYVRDTPAVLTPARVAGGGCILFQQDRFSLGLLERPLGGKSLFINSTFGALFYTHIVAPRTPYSYFALEDQLQMSSPITPHRTAETLFLFFS